MSNNFPLKKSFCGKRKNKSDKTYFLGSGEVFKKSVFLFEKIVSKNFPLSGNGKRPTLVREKKSFLLKTKPHKHSIKSRLYLKKRTKS